MSPPRCCTSLSAPFQATPPLHQFALSTITALCGADAFERAFSVVTRPRLVCIHFRPSGVASPPSSPISEQTHVQEDSASQTTEHSEHAYDQGEWVVLDMLDDNGELPILSTASMQ
jgi:hypothetical protein